MILGKFQLQDIQFEFEIPALPEGCNIFHLYVQVASINACLQIQTNIFSQKVTIDYAPASNFGYVSIRKSRNF